ncbi:hypothetical protein PENSPDRAFT_98177 [Peniophora sp. CONT]|nr:hypothetical protein PENSPDRAFT_98177 [Peniophora sp. CONT]
MTYKSAARQKLFERQLRSVSLCGQNARMGRRSVQLCMCTSCISAHKSVPIPHARSSRESSGEVERDLHYQCRWETHNRGKSSHKGPSDGTVRPYGCGYTHLARNWRVETSNWASQPPRGVYNCGLVVVRRGRPGRRRSLKRHPTPTVER